MPLLITWREGDPVSPIFQRVEACHDANHVRPRTSRSRCSCLALMSAVALGVSATRSYAYGWHPDRPYDGFWDSSDVEYPSPPAPVPKRRECPSPGSGAGRSGAVVPLTSAEIIELAASIGLGVPTSAGTGALVGGTPVRQLSSFPAAAVRQAFRQLRSGHSSWDEWLERARKLARGTTAATPSPGRKTTPSVSQEADGSGRSLSFGDAAVAVVGMPVKRYAGLSRRGWQVIGLSQLVCSECDDRLGVIQHTVSGAVALLCAHDKESWPLDEYSSATRRDVEEFVRSQFEGRG